MQVLPISLVYSIAPRIPPDRVCVSMSVLFVSIPKRTFYFIKMVIGVYIAHFIFRTHTVFDKLILMKNLQASVRVSACVTRRS